MLRILTRHSPGVATPTVLALFNSNNAIASADNVAINAAPLITGGPNGYIMLLGAFLLLIAAFWATDNSGTPS